MPKTPHAKKLRSRRKAKASPAEIPPIEAGGETPIAAAASPKRRSAKRPSAGKRRARPRARPRKTFLVAATPEGDAAGLRVYAVVKRSEAEALAAVTAWLGPGVAVELTGSLSGRMARALGLKPDEVRQI